MARLFITQRELDFFSDIAKEVIKDINAQKIYYYPISEEKTKAHPIYDEAIRKIFDNPIIIEALIDNSFEKDTIINQFGIDKNFKIEVFVQYRDMIERGIEPSIGDYFTFSDVIFEITEVKVTRNIYGQAEHSDGIRIVGTPAREDSIAIKILGPTDIKYSDSDAVQKEFVQQRGYTTNDEGDTSDTRALVNAGVIDPGLTGPKKVNEAADSNGRNAFYGED